MNWDTLKFRTRKLLVIVISKTFRRFSPILIIQTLSSLSEMKCSFSEIEMIGKEVQIELNEKNNNDFEILKVFQIIKSNQDFEEFENKNKNDNNNNEKENEIIDKIVLKNFNENLQDDILLSPKKRKLPLFSTFTKIDLFELISNFVIGGQFNNWEIINLLTCVTNLGTTLHDFELLFYFAFLILLCFFFFLSLPFLIIVPSLFFIFHFSFFISHFIFQLSYFFSVFIFRGEF